jgi:hypothetical protein
VFQGLDNEQQSNSAKNRNTKTRQTSVAQDSKPCRKQRHQPHRSKTQVPQNPLAEHNDISTYSKRGKQSKKILKNNFHETDENKGMH